MYGYRNLKVVSTDEGKGVAEVRYNIDAQQATIYADTDADIKRGIADLEGRGVLLPERKA